MKLGTISEAIAEIKKGKLVIVVDDEDRENEGDFITAAVNVTSEIINFMATHGRGLICVPMTNQRLAELDLQPMVPHNTSLMGTPFTVSVDAIEGTTTGISAADRAKTIHTLIEPQARPGDLARPGHVFPLRAREGGVLVRAGHTEAAVDLARLAGFSPAGVLVEIMNDDGTMARGEQLEQIASRFGLVIISIADLIEYRHRTEQLVHWIARDLDLPTRYGAFKLNIFENLIDHQQQMALVKGDLHEAEPMLVRVHTHCLTGDVFASLRCDCYDQLTGAMQQIQSEGRGVLLYMRPDLLDSFRPHSTLSSATSELCHAQAKPGLPMSQRQYGIGAQILAMLGLTKIRLLSNNPKKFVGLKSFGLEIIEQVPMKILVNKENETYLKAKQLQIEYLLGMDEIQNQDDERKK